MQSCHFASHQGAIIWRFNEELVRFVATAKGTDEYTLLKDAEFHVGSSDLSGRHVILYEGAVWQNITDAEDDDDSQWSFIPDKGRLSRTENVDTRTNELYCPSNLLFVRILSSQEVKTEGESPNIKTEEEGT